MVSGELQSAQNGQAIGQFAPTYVWDAKDQLVKETTSIDGSDVVLSSPGRVPGG